MIVKLTFSFKKPLEIPINYNYFLQSAIYRNLDKALSDFLHNHGFEFKKRKFKLFTFSRIISNFSIYDNNIVFQSPIHIYFASIIDDLVISLISNLLNKGYIFISKRRLKFKSYRIIKPNLDKNVFRTLSPITIYRTHQNKIIFYNPKDEDFKNLILENLKKKFILVYSKEFSGDFEFEFLNYKKEVIKYKNGIIVAYSGKIKINTTNEMKEIILNCGIGAKNSIGLGMVL